MSYETSKAFKAHIDELRARAEGGDVVSIKSLSAIALLAEGWRYGDPDPSDDPPNCGGESIVNLSAYRLRLAA